MNKTKRKNLPYLLGDILGVLFAAVIFIIPFLFMFVNSLKDRQEASLLSLKWPEIMQWENYKEVLMTDNGILLISFKNSLLITLGSVLILIITCAMAGYVLQRRNDKISSLISGLLLTGLMVPPAIMPTIWLLQGINLYKTKIAMVLIEVALQAPFTVMLYRGFMSSIPREIEEAGYIDGCNRVNLFARIIFPLLKPITASVIILNSVTIFNDFQNPLYFLPGRDNSTVQLTLYNFMGRYSNSYNLLFADVILITIPMLILFIFFNRKIVDGMVAGSVKA